MLLWSHFFHETRPKRHRWQYVLYNVRELRKGLQRFFGREFAQLKCLWPKLVAGPYGFGGIPRLPDAPQEAFSFGEFPCGLLHTIIAPAKPLNVLNELGDELFTFH